jgi:hypothetical protein
VDTVIIDTQAHIVVPEITRQATEPVKWHGLCLFLPEVDLGTPPALQ